LDGYSWYGRHLSESAVGYSTPLDDCGGHSHGDYGYHYHSQVLNLTVSDTNFIAYIATPHKCWRGNVSTITNFLKMGTDDTSKPCCNDKNIYYAASTGTVTAASSESSIVGIANPSMRFPKIVPTSTKTLSSVQSYSTSTKTLSSVHNLYPSFTLIIFSLMALEMMKSG
jgi:hypothetical protein